jgi:hypothetical protein
VPVQLPPLSPLSPQVAAAAWLAAQCTSQWRHFRPRVLCFQAVCSAAVASSSVCPICSSQLAYRYAFTGTRPTAAPAATPVSEHQRSNQQQQAAAAAASVQHLMQLVAGVASPLGVSVVCFAEGPSTPSSAVGCRWPAAVALLCVCLSKKQGGVVLGLAWLGASPPEEGLKAATLGCRSARVLTLGVLTRWTGTGGGAAGRC